MIFKKQKDLSNNKNRNWIWVALKLLLLLIVNGGTIVWIILNMVANGTSIVEIGFVTKQVDIDYFMTLDWEWKLTVYILMILGWCATYGLLKLFYKTHVTRKENDKARAEQEKNRANATENSRELANTIGKTVKDIMEGKK